MIFLYFVIVKLLLLCVTVWIGLDQLEWLLFIFAQAQGFSLSVLKCVSRTRVKTTSYSPLFRYWPYLINFHYTGTSFFTIINKKFCTFSVDLLLHNIWKFQVQLLLKYFRFGIVAAWPFRNFYESKRIYSWSWLLKGAGIVQSYSYYVTGWATEEPGFDFR